MKFRQHVLEGIERFPEAYDMLFNGHNQGKLLIKTLNSLNLLNGNLRGIANGDIENSDERFENLQDYDFTPHYTTIKDKDGTDIRIHHVDEGNPEGKPILMMHGNPGLTCIGI